VLVIQRLQQQAFVATQQHNPAPSQTHLRAQLSQK
jgi:hypothetical protein